MAKRKRRKKKPEPADEEDLGPAESFRTLERPWRRLVESVYAGRNPDTGTVDDDRFYQSLDVAAALDLPPAFHKAAQRLSLLLYRKNVRAYRAIELVKNFVLGDGVKVTAHNEAVEKLVERHWAANEWSEKDGERLRGLSIFGEQLWPAFVARDGLVRISSVSPLRIVRLNTDPQDGERVVSVVAALGNRQRTKPKTFRIIRENEKGRLEGNAFYFPVNRVIGGRRGTPDMLSAVDWLEGLDGMIFALLERSSLAQNVVYDLKYDGANTQEIRKHVKDFVRSLRAGGVYGHNEKTALDIQTPKLGASESETASRLVVRQIQSGLGLAGLFFGDSDDLTRASASELSVPVAKHIQGRQEEWKRVLTKVLRFQIEQAEDRGTLRKDADNSFQVRMPKVFLRDMTTMTNSLVQLASSLELAVAEGWVSASAAGAAYRAALEQLGPVDGDAVETVEEGESAYSRALGRRHENGEAQGG